MISKLHARLHPSAEQMGVASWPSPHLLSVGRGHYMAWRDLGSRFGQPWLVIHGGPGSGSRPNLIAPLNLHTHRAIVPDQRGCGASRPLGCTRGNHTKSLVEDLETLRRHLGIERWSILAGSWGVVVALAYVQQHTHRVQRMVLRGAFALKRREIGGLLQPGPQTLRRLGPEPYWPSRVGCPLQIVLRRLEQVFQCGTTSVASTRVVRRWALLEIARVERGLQRSERLARLEEKTNLAAAIRHEWSLLHRDWRRKNAQARQKTVSRNDRGALHIYRVQVHYLRHRGFMLPGQLDRAVLQLAKKGVPVDWVHGRCDSVCPPANSRHWAALSGGRPDLPLAGHLLQEPALLAALRTAVGERR